MVVRERAASIANPQTCRADVSTIIRDPIGRGWIQGLNWLTQSPLSKSSPLCVSHRSPTLPRRRVTVLRPLRFACNRLIANRFCYYGFKKEDRRFDRRRARRPGVPYITKKVCLCTPLCVADRGVSTVCRCEAVLLEVDRERSVFVCADER